MTPKLLLDNSAFSLLHCKRQFQLTVAHGLKGRDNKWNLFGSAFHKAVELLDKAVPVDDVLKTLVINYPTVNHKLLITTIYLFKSCVKLPPPIILSDNKPAVENKFELPYKELPPSQDYPNGLDIRLCGTIDRIYIDSSDKLVILDYKTAANVSNIKDKLQEYYMTFQLPFYLHCALKFLPKEYSQYIYDDRYETRIMGVFYNCTPPEFKPLIRGPFSHDFLFNEVPAIIDANVNTSLEVFKLGTKPAIHDGMCSGACKFCDYSVACMAMGTERELEFLERFDRKDYNPLMFR